MGYILFAVLDDTSSSISREKKSENDKLHIGDIRFLHNFHGLPVLRILLAMKNHSFYIYTAILYYAVIAEGYEQK